MKRMDVPWILIVLAAGCARAAPRPTTPPSLPKVSAQSANRWECWPKASYGPAQVTTILDMRARGESLKAVARQVGGSRQDVRAVERRQRKHPWPRAGVRDASPPLCPDMVTTAGARRSARRTGP
jgi:hypothetical protein